MQGEERRMGGQERHEDGARSKVSMQIRAEVRRGASRGTCQRCHLSTCVCVRAGTSLGHWLGDFGGPRILGVGASLCPSG